MLCSIEDMSDACSAEISELPWLPCRKHCMLGSRQHTSPMIAARLLCSADALVVSSSVCAKMYAQIICNKYADAIWQLHMDIRIPVHQAVPPLAVLHILGWPLSLMAVHIGNDLAHVLQVIVSVLVITLLQQVADDAPGLVACGLATVWSPSHLHSSPYS